LLLTKNNFSSAENWPLRSTALLFIACALKNPLDSNFELVDQHQRGWRRVAVVLVVPLLTSASVRPARGSSPSTLMGKNYVLLFLVL
jgi:hypothetical protein